MRVLLVDLESAWRGGQSQALLLLRGLAEKGHYAELLSVNGSALGERARADGIAVHDAQAGFRRVGAARILQRLLREPRFDVIHANEAHALTAAWLARAHRSAALVASRRVAFPLSGQGRARYRAAQRILAVSQHVARSVIASGIEESAVSVVYDGVAIPAPASCESRSAARERLGLDAGGLLLGCVGYLLPEKGQEWLVRALPAIRDSVPGVRLLLAGDGPERPRLEQLARQLGVETSVRFAGHVENVAEVYSALDVFVFPSLEEPLGSSLLAAMACGLPVAAGAGGGVPEIVEAGVTGLLFPPRDPAGIATAAVRLLSDREMATRLGTAARDVVQATFTADRMVEGTLRIYGDVCGARGSR